MNAVRDIILMQWMQRRRRARRLAAQRRDAQNLRMLRDESNPFEMPEARFQSKYRLSRVAAQNLVEELRPHMLEPQRTTAIPIHMKGKGLGVGKTMLRSLHGLGAVLVALHFFGHGSDQKGVAADHTAPMSQTRVSRSLTEVVAALNNIAILRENIRFPQTPEERRAVMQRNYQRSRIPGVLGYVDGAHMYIVAPVVHEEQYVNRHQTHSLNVQVVCDSDMVILNVVARYPGATHGSFVWANSAIRQKMEEMYRGGEQCWLLGDSGYPHEPWLHVPILDAAPKTPEENFTKAHMIDWSVVERTIGHLRNRFRYLSKHRVLEYNPVKAGQIVNACTVLHNKCVRARVPALAVDEDEDEDGEDDPAPPPAVVERGPARDRLLAEARQVRARLVTRVPPLPGRQPFNPQRLNCRH